MQIALLVLFAFWLGGFVKSAMAIAVEHKLGSEVTSDDVPMIVFCTVLWPVVTLDALLFWKKTDEQE